MINGDIYWEMLKAVTPNGTQTLSKMPNKFVDGVYPKVLDHGKGGHVWDVDNNEYIDLIAGLGCISVGYNVESINEKVIKQLHKGVSFSLPNTLEYLIARRLIDLVPFTDSWKFFKTGTEADMAAIRVARAFNGRDKVLTCGYHGWADWYAIQNNRKAGIPEFNAKLVDKATYNDLSSFHKILDGKYAAVILEPMVWENPKDGFLQTIRDWCTTSQTMLIFDEVVTGGRFKDFVAANHFEVKPDLIVLSKGIANGFPLAAVGGGILAMSTFERDDFFVSGTFGGECISLVACYETLSILKKSINTMYINGLRIREYFNQLFFNTGAVCRGYPTRLTFDFPNIQLKGLFMQEMCLNGVLTGYSNMIMAEHTSEDVEKICTAILKTHTVMLKHWKRPDIALLGNPPEEALRLR